MNAINTTQAITAITVPSSFAQLANNISEAIKMQQQTATQITTAAPIGNATQPFHYPMAEIVVGAWFGQSGVAVAKPAIEFVQANPGHGTGDSTSSNSINGQPVKRGRGRPRKYPLGTKMAKPQPQPKQPPQPARRRLSYEVLEPANFKIESGIPHFNLNGDGRRKDTLLNRLKETFAAMKIDDSVLVPLKGWSSLRRLIHKNRHTLGIGISYQKQVAVNGEEPMVRVWRMK